MTPQGKVIDLPHGATPIDFAYRVHTDLGHRCRGAKLDGQLVPLNTPLRNGPDGSRSRQPSRAGRRATGSIPQLGYLATAGARTKVKRWFGNLEEAQTLAQGRAFVLRELQRDGQTQANIDELARKLGYADVDALYLAAGRNEVGPRQLQVALRPAEPAQAPQPDEIKTQRSRAAGGGDVLIVGVSNLLTQLGRCCRPAPPDAIAGFVTRGKGVSIHRVDCRNFAHMVARNPERMITADWGEASDALYPVDIFVEANDRQGLLRDISEALSRDKINVIAVNTQSRQGRAYMGFTVEVNNVPQVMRTLGMIKEIKSVIEARRA